MTRLGQYQKAISPSNRKTSNSSKIRFTVCLEEEQSCHSSFQSGLIILRLKLIFLIELSTTYSVITVCTGEHPSITELLAFFNGYLLRSNLPEDINLPWILSYLMLAVVNVEIG